MAEKGTRKGATGKGPGKGTGKPTGGRGSGWASPKKSGRPVSRTATGRPNAKPPARPAKKTPVAVKPVEAVVEKASEEFIAGRQAVAEALKGGRSVNKIWMTSGQRSPAMEELRYKAKETGVVIQEVTNDRLESLVPGLRHQGIVHSVAPVRYWELEELLELAAEGPEPGFLVILDGLEDPQNVGAILRSADAAGVHGVLLPKRRSCPLSGAVARASAGALEHVPVAHIGNVAQTIGTLKKAGYWVVGADAEGTGSLFTADLQGPVALVIGSEGYGLSRLVKENCDYLVSIPMKGKIGSLNASVASALMMYEVVRRRDAVTGDDA